MTYEYVPKLIRAALNNDRKNIESIALMLGRKIKKEDPDTSAEIMRILACTNTGTDVMRSMDLSPIPVDRETRNRLVNLEEPVCVENPILEDAEMEELNQFIQERNLLDKFLEEDIVPPNSILLHGKPGVGKTYISKWLSYKLNMPIVTLDLANSISSYLGRSGQNIKSIFQYAKEQNVILFLDEIDAIAKRRDDATDLGELKRLVNVLLKELESCPVTCIVVGATNHPELLDKAIWRRFDRNIEITLPEREQRRSLIQRGMGKIFSIAVFHLQLPFRTVNIFKFLYHFQYRRHAASPTVATIRERNIQFIPHMSFTGSHIILFLENIFSVIPIHCFGKEIVKVLRQLFRFRTGRFIQAIHTGNHFIQNLR